MASFNQETSELAAKIVYCGPGCSGKTMNLHYIHHKLAPTMKEELLTLKTETERTLYFDFLTIRIGAFRNVKVRFLLFSVPGQVFYNEARKLVLKSADAIVFVADSQRSRLRENKECFLNMEQNLVQNGLDPATIPLILQYNKRDLPDKVTVSNLNLVLNKHNKAYFKAIATQGGGVIETFRAISKLVLNNLSLTQSHIFEVKRGLTIVE
ncbi:ATP/GTP-binding protein [candidate division CSSED10-310 bacterium]|uniref:ATP/GTP-binding protein n=1 Tax=candidate division CSSED10-310 bacterium TaxID=2855610 RepID=A0ABV6Z5D6_UNCC1